VNPSATGCEARLRGLTTKLFDGLTTKPFDGLTTKPFDGLTTKPAQAVADDILQDHTASAMVWPSDSPRRRRWRWSPSTVVSAKNPIQPASAALALVAEHGSFSKEPDPARVGGLCPARRGLQPDGDGVYRNRCISVITPTATAFFAIDASA
jgi:hypothetical protein